MQSGAATLAHEPFSRSLGRILLRDRGHLTANRVLAVSLMEEDGVMIWFGYLASLAATAYFIFFGALLVNHLGGWLRAGLHWLGMTR